MPLKHFCRSRPYFSTDFQNFFSTDRSWIDAHLTKKTAFQPHKGLRYQGGGAESAPLHATHNNLYPNTGRFKCNMKFFSHKKTTGRSMVDHYLDFQSMIIIFSYNITKAILYLNKNVQDARIGYQQKYSDKGGWTDIDTISYGQSDLQETSNTLNHVI